PSGYDHLGSTSKLCVFVFAMAAFSFSQLGCFSPVGTTAASFLRNARSNPDPNLRYRAYAALGSPNCYDSPEQKADAVKWMASVLDSGREPTATHAVICRSLGELGDTAALPALRRTVEDPNGTIRAEACRAIGSLGTPQDATLLARIAAADHQ